MVCFPYWTKTNNVARLIPTADLYIACTRRVPKIDRCAFGSVKRVCWWLLNATEASAFVFSSVALLFVQSVQSHCCLFSLFSRIAVCSVCSVALLFVQSVQSHCCLFSLFSRIAVCSVCSVALLFVQSVQSHCCLFSLFSRIAVCSVCSVALLFVQSVQSHCCLFSLFSRIAVCSVCSVALLFVQSVQSHCCFFSCLAVSSLLFLQSHCCFFSRIAVSSVALLAGRSDQSSRDRFRRADVLSLKNSASTVLLNNHEPVWPSGKSGVVYMLVSGRTRRRFDSASALLSLRKLWLSILTSRDCPSRWVKR